jgi:CSLREA domain-containing protein
VLNLNGAGGAESGDLDILQPMTITGALIGLPPNYNSLPRIQADFPERLFDIGQNVAVSFHGLRLTDGAPSGLAGTNGGAIRVTAAGANVSVDRVRFLYNTAATGAAISNSGTLVVERSDFFANVATTAASAIQTNASGNTTLRGSSIREIRNEGATREALRVSQGGTLIVENTYIDGASEIVFPAPTPTTGIRADRPALLAVRNATLVDFTERALDLVADASTTLSVYNSILAGSDLADCALGQIAGPPPILAFEWNLMQMNGCGVAVGNSNQIGFPALLGAVEQAPNRFYVTRRPPFGSRAIDLGAPADAPGSDPLRLCMSVDMLGTPRPLDGDANGVPRCDIGAVEAAALSSSTYVVNVYDADLTDASPGDDACDADLLMTGPQCTLRAAVMEANAKPGPDRISFAGGPGNRTLMLTIAGAGGAAAGDLDVIEQLAIEGAADPQAPGVVSINAVPGDRLFDVALPVAQSFRLRDVQVRNGSGFDGGAMRVNAALAELERVDFVTNATGGSGGAVWAEGGVLAVRDSDFSANQAALQGAAIHSSSGAVVIENTSLRNNISPSGGAALAVVGSTSLNVRNSTLHRNSAGIRADSALVIDVRASTIAGHDAQGLQVSSGAMAATVLVRATVFADNTDHCQFIGGFGANVMAWNHVDAADPQCAPAGSNSGVGPALLAPAVRRDASSLSAYRVPLHGSPLIDAIPGDAGPLLCAGRDTRGLDRPLDSDGDGNARCEIGAVELTADEAGPREFVVNVTADNVDPNPGDGRCGTGPACSLRAAIMEANALPGEDLVTLEPSVTPYAIAIPGGAGPADASGDIRITDGLRLRGAVDAPNDRPTIAAGTNDRLLSVVNVNTPVIIEGLRLTGGLTPFSGGALSIVNSSAVTLRQLEIAGHTAIASGGAIDVTGSTMLIEDSDLHDNHTDGPGAAIRSDASFLEIRRTSIRANTDGGVSADQEALHAGGDGSTLVQNSTFSGNAGTALRIVDGDLEARNVTLAGNGRRGIEFARLDGRNLLIRNSALTGNELGACAYTGAGNPGVATDGQNLTQGTGCDLHAGASNIVNAGPVLGPLVAATAEFSAYHVPLAGSVLRDNGHPDVSALGCTPTDQRGAIRPVDGNGDGIARCDIGAIEATVATSELFRDGFE